VPGYIEDRWWTKPGPDGQRRKKSRHGQGLRWRVVGIPGVKDESFAKRADAETWLATAQTDVRRGQYIDPDLGQITLRDYVETVWWPARHDPVGTAGPMRSKIRNHILPYLGHIPIALIDVEHLRAWVAALRRSGRVSESTIEIIWIHLTTILGSAVGKRILRNPCLGMGADRPTRSFDTKARAWTPQEVKDIRAGLGEWYKVVVDLGVSAGLRQGEAFGISPDDVDEDRMLLHVRRQLQWDPGKPYMKLPKNDHERDVPLSPGLLKAIRAHEDAHGSVDIELPWKGPGNDRRPTIKTRLLIATWFSNPVNASRFNKTNWKPALVAAGLLDPKADEGDGWEPSRELMFHRCRHTYASVQLHAGEDVVSVSKWMGHASPEITLKTYAHFMPDLGLRGRTAVDEWLGE